MAVTKAPVFLFSLLLVGCASNESAGPAFKQLPDVSYAAPTSRPVPASAFTVDGSVAETVGRLVESLNGPRFGITHVDRQAGVITATFNADPDDYLDCGELTLVSSQGETRTVPAASRSLVYEIPIEQKTRVGSIDRQLTLDGRLILQVAPAGPGQSRVQVSGDYVLTRTASLIGSSAQTLADQKQYLAFGSGQAVGFSGGGSTICQSNGELEQQALARGNLAAAASTFDELLAQPEPAVPADARGTWSGSLTDQAAGVPAIPPVNPSRSAFPESAAVPASSGLQQVRAEFDQLACAPLTAIEDDDGIRVTGFVGSQAALDQLKDSVRSLDSVGDVNFQVVVTSASFCEILEVSLPLHERNSLDDAGASIGVDGSAVVLQEGDRVVLRANAPNFDSYVYIIYMQEDGKLLNLVPSLNQTDSRRSANQSFSIGDQSDQPSFTVSPPYGDDLVMLVASSEPLFTAPRPLIEEGGAFADELQRSVDDLLSRGGRVVADLVFLRTSPRSS
jgi:hypothetical protein